MEVSFHSKLAVKAEIHFISLDQWKDDLQTLHDDASDPLSEADVAQSKVRHYTLKLFYSKPSSTLDGDLVSRLRVGGVGGHVS